MVLYYRIKRWTGATAPRSEAAPPVLETPDAVVGAIGDAGTEDRPESPGAEGGLSDEEEEWIRRQIGKVG